MIHETNETDKLNIEDSTLSFKEIHSKNYFPKEYEAEIKNSNLLLLPYEVFRDRKKPVFPEETQKYYHYLLKNKEGNLEPEICIADEDYLELELHADLVTLPLLLLDKTVLPLVISLTANYLWEKRAQRKTKINLKFEMTVVDGDKSKKISYEGDSENFEKVLKAAEKDFFSKDTDQ